jgi:hypothetical protein
MINCFTKHYECIIADINSAVIETIKKKSQSQGEGSAMVENNEEDLPTDGEYASLNINFAIHLMFISSCISTNIGKHVKKHRTRN